MLEETASGEAFEKGSPPSINPFFNTKMNVECDLLRKSLAHRNEKFPFTVTTKEVEDM